MLWVSNVPTVINSRCLFSRCEIVFEVKSAGVNLAGVNQARGQLVGVFCVDVNRAGVKKV